MMANPNPLTNICVICGEAFPNGWGWYRSNCHGYVCDRCDDEYYFCGVCETYAQWECEFCSHMFFDKYGQLLGSGGYDGYEYCKEPLFIFLNEFQGFDVAILLSLIKQEVDHHDHLWDKLQELENNSKLFYECKNEFDINAHPLWVGFKWLMSLDYPHTEEALELTKKWIQEWRESKSRSES